LTDTAKYLLRGGPFDGKEVDPPPSVLHTVTEDLAERFGASYDPTNAKISGEGWIYEFSADEPGVLIGRPMTEQELAVDEAFAELREEDRRIAVMHELSPHVLRTLKQAHRLLEGNNCVAARRDDVAIFVARGETAAEWERVLGALDADRGCAPEPIPDVVWERL